MSAPSPEVWELAAAVAEALDIPLPAIYTAKTMEQHRQVLMFRACQVRWIMADVADDCRPLTLPEAARLIRETVEDHPVTYTVERRTEVAS